ncbi:MAG: hypothetical protein H7330_15075, partial [Hymenobacteraceae bacterium]|nr:hypothetical protein [Hymenobacteraceae bacterium]
MTQLVRRPMGMLKRCTLLALAGGLLLAGPATAQRACIRVFDQDGDSVLALCVGKTYQLRHCDEPLGPNTVVVYDTTGATPPRYVSPGSSTVIRFNTPGPRRIYQLANLTGPPGIETSRVYQVFPTAMPRVRVDPCLRNVRVTIVDRAYLQCKVIISLDGQPAPNKFAGVGATVVSELVGGTAAATVHLIVTGYNYSHPDLPLPPDCESTPFDTTFTLPAIAEPARIRRLDVLAPTAAHRVRLELAGLVPGGRYVI